MYIKHQNTLTPPTGNAINEGCFSVTEVFQGRGKPAERHPIMEDLLVWF